MSGHSKVTPPPKKKSGVKPRLVCQRLAQVSMDASVIIITADILKVCHVVVAELIRSCVQHVSTWVVCFIWTNVFFCHFLWCHLIWANDDGKCDWLPFSSHIRSYPTEFLLNLKLDLSSMTSSSAVEMHSRADKLPNKVRGFGEWEEYL